MTHSATPTGERGYRPTVGGHLDISSTRPASFARLVRVELRKMADTRSGRWLLIAIVAVTAAILAVVFFTADDVDQTFYTFLGATYLPQQFLLPVLGILLVTSEWGQRTALTTFTLTPRRTTAIGAKVVAAVVFGLLALVVSLALAALMTVLAGNDNAWSGVSTGLVARLALLQVSVIVLGLAFGLLFLNGAAAIVTWFVLPQAFTIVANRWSTLGRAAPWIDINTAQTHLTDEAMTGHQWLQLLVASTIWIVVPLVLGFVRVLRAEVK